MREWRHIVEGGAIDILNALNDGAKNLNDVYARLAQGYGRAPGQRLRVLAMLAGQDVNVSMSELRTRAEQYLRSRADELFRHRITVRDGSECGLAREPVVVDAKGRRSLKEICKKAECQCRQPDFLEARREDVVRVGEALREHRAHQKAGRLAVEVMRSPDPLERKGKKCWGGSGLGGDISIALECGADETLLATDASFDVICPRLRVRHERIGATPPP